MSMDPSDGGNLQWLWNAFYATLTGVFMLLGKLSWGNHKEIQKNKDEFNEWRAYVMREYPTKSDLESKLTDIVLPLKESHERIEDKIDMLIQRELDKKGE